MTSALVRFLGSAALGVLRVGMAPSDIVSYVGCAFARTGGDGSAEIWKYGPLQLTIENGKLGALKLNCLERSPLPMPLHEIEVPPGETTLYAFIDMLDENGVGWEIDTTYSFDRQLCIRTEGGVRAYFDLDHRELQSIQV